MKHRKLEQLLGSAFYWAGELNKIRVREHRFPSLISPSYQYAVGVLPQIVKNPLLAPLTQESLENFQRQIRRAEEEKIKIEQVQSSLDNLALATQIQAPEERYAATRRGIEQLHGLGFVDFQYSADARAVFSQMEKLKAQAKAYAAELYPGAITAYFGISDALDRAKSFKFFKSRRLYEGQLSLDLVAQDLSKSYAAVSADVRTNALGRLDAAINCASSGLGSLEAGNFANAVISYETLAGVEHYPQAHYLAGVSYQSMGQHKEAIRHFKQAAKYDINREVVPQMHVRRKLWSARAGRWFGWVGKVADTIASADERLERGDRILRQQQSQLQSERA